MVTMLSANVMKTVRPAISGATERQKGHHAESAIGRAKALLTASLPLPAQRTHVEEHGQETLRKPGKVRNGPREVIKQRSVANLLEATSLNVFISVSDTGGEIGAATYAAPVPKAAAENLLDERSRLAVHIRLCGPGGVLLRS